MERSLRPTKYSGNSSTAFCKHLLISDFFMTQRASEQNSLQGIQVNMILSGIGNFYKLDDHMLSMVSLVW